VEHPKVQGLAKQLLKVYVKLHRCGRAPRPTNYVFYNEALLHMLDPSPSTEEVLRLWTLSRQELVNYTKFLHRPQ
jgi:hypothetical protein